jgi:hypothetical protein
MQGLKRRHPEGSDAHHAEGGCSPAARLFAPEPAPAPAALAARGGVPSAKSEVSVSANLARAAVLSPYMGLISLSAGQWSRGSSLPLRAIWLFDGGLVIHIQRRG